MKTSKLALALLLTSADAIKLRNMVKQDKNDQCSGYLTAEPNYPNSCSFDDENYLRICSAELNEGKEFSGIGKLPKCGETSDLITPPAEESKETEEVVHGCVDKCDTELRGLANYPAMT